ncbi:MAG: hypothetical protein ACHQXL_01275 [Candidatus Limnocylindrales bacterium]
MDQPYARPGGLGLASRPAGGIRIELTARTQAVRSACAEDLGQLALGDPRRQPLEEQAAELDLLLDDLASQLASPRVLQAIALARAGAGGTGR